MRPTSSGAIAAAPPGWRSSSPRRTSGAWRRRWRAGGWRVRSGCSPTSRNRPSTGTSSFGGRFRAGAKGELDDAIAWAERAADLGRRHGDRDLEALALHLQGSFLVSSGALDEGWALAPHPPQSFTATRHRGLARRSRLSRPRRPRGGADRRARRGGRGAGELADARGRGPGRRRASRGAAEGACATHRGRFRGLALKAPLAVPTSGRAGLACSSV